MLRVLALCLTAACFGSAASAQVGEPETIYAAKDIEIVVDSLINNEGGGFIVSTHTNYKTNVTYGRLYVECSPVVLFDVLSTGKTFASLDRASKEQLNLVTPTKASLLDVIVDHVCSR